MIDRISSSIRSVFGPIKRSSSDTLKKIQDSPKIVIEKLKSTPLSTKVAAGSVCLAVPVLIYSLFIKKASIQEQPHSIKQPPLAADTQIDLLIKERQDRRSAICSFSTQLALTFEYNKDQLSRRVKEQSQKIIATQDSNLVPFPKSEQEDLTEYGLYCALIAY